MPENHTGPLLSVQDLSVHFPTGRTKSTPVTHEVSFTLDSGETLAIVGESGSGKSVTAMSLVDLLPHGAHQTGTVTFAGEDLSSPTPERLARLRGGEIAVVFQEPMTALNPVYTIGALIGQAMGGARLSRQERNRRGVELLERVGMPDPQTRMRRYPHELSGGQRQRAMIAMAIARSPRMLIADEPTTALDVTAQAEILDLLRELRDDLGMALLIITHDMGVVADMADRVLVMNQGRVVEEAPVHELFASPREGYTRDLLAAVPHLGRGSGLRPPAAEREHDGAGAAAAAPLLSVRDLTVVYPGGLGKRAFTAVDAVTFDIAPGETIGLVGESGSGKSTIGRTVVGIAAPTAGTIFLDGTTRSRRTRPDPGAAALIFQDPSSSLDPRQTIGCSITNPLIWNGVERGRSALGARARDLLKSVHLPPEFADRYPHELSGGQRQRVGIARALAMEPRLLVADEPTSALDVSVQAAVLELLTELQERLGFSCLFVSHDLSVVERLAHRVIVLRRGEVVEQGHTDQVLFDPQHSYTQSLVRSIPVPDPEHQRERRRIRLLEEHTRIA